MKLIYIIQVIISAFILSTCVIGFAVYFDIFPIYLLIVLLVCSIGSIYIFADGIDKLNNNKREKVK